MRNRKGDIPITILVAGVIAVCILTLFSFYYFTNKQKETFAGPGLIETIYSIQEEIEFGKGENLNHFEKDGVKIDFDNGKITAEYVIKQGLINKQEKNLVSVEYTPIE